MSGHAPLVIDVAGTALTYVDRRRLVHPLVGGLILFARNWESRAQLTTLCDEVKSLRPDLLIGVDHEGGRVQRFRDDGFTHLPAMRELGRLWADDAMAAQGAASACGLVLASELRACGVDLSFAPVLDLDWPDPASGESRSSVIASRSFHADARVVTLLAKSLMHGMLRAGMAHCAKHFPGHGHVSVDSHHGVPRDPRSLKALLADDAAPYRWLGSVLTAVMPAHVVYSRIDRRPAGFSARWLQDILRGRLGFDGAIISDDLSMAGAREVEGQTLSPTEAVLAALQAGCDLALLCNQSLGQGEVIDEVLAGLERAGPGARQVAGADSLRRVRALLPRGDAPDWDALQQRSDYRGALNFCRMPGSQSA